MCDSAFKESILILVRNLKNENDQRFPIIKDNTRKHPDVLFDSKKYVIEIKAVIDDFVTLRNLTKGSHSSVFSI